MAKKLTKTGITTGNTVKAFHVTQSIDAFSGTDAYDIVLSGSLILSGSFNNNGPFLQSGNSIFTGNITSSANVSSSGNVTAGNITAGIITANGRFSGNGSTLTNLQRPISNSVSTHFTASNLNAGFYFRAGGNVTCSIQSGSLVACETGNEYEIFQTSSAGNIIFVTGSGVTLNSKNSNIKLTGQFSAATLKKISTNPDTWDLIGDLN